MRVNYIIILFIGLLTINIGLAKANEMNISDSVGVEKFVEQFNYYAKPYENIYKINSYKIAGAKNGETYYDCFIEDGISPKGTLLIAAVSSPNGYLNSLAIIIDRNAKSNYRAAIYLAAITVQATTDMDGDDQLTILNSIEEFAKMKTGKENGLDKFWRSNNGKTYYVRCHNDDTSGALVVYIRCA